MQGRCHLHAACSNEQGESSPFIRSPLAHGDLSRKMDRFINTISVRCYNVACLARTEQ